MATKVLAFLITGKDELSGVMNNAGKNAEKHTGTIVGTLKKTSIAWTALGAAIGGVFGKAIADARQLNLAPLTVAAKNAGIAWKEFYPQVTEAGKRMSNLGFTQGQTNAALTKLVTATRDGRTSLNALGVVADFARFKHIGLSDAALMLTRAASGNTRALRDLGISAGDLPPKFAKTGTEASRLHLIMGLVNKRIGGEAVAYANTFGGKLEVLKAKFTNLSAQLGTVVLPWLSKLMTVVISVISWFQNLPGPVKAATGAFLGIAATAIPIVLAAAKITTAIKAIIPVVKAVGIAMKVAAVGNPWILLAAAIATAVILIITHWNAVKNATAACWNAVRSVTLTVWNAIVGFLRNIWNGMLAAARAVFGALRAFLGSVWNGIRGTATATWNAIRAFFQAVWNVIRQIFGVAVNAIRGFLAGSWNAMRSAAQATWNAVRAFFQAVWNGIRLIFSVAVNAIRSWLSGQWNMIRSSTQAVWNAIRAFFQAVWNIIRQIFSVAVNAIRGFLSASWNNVRGGVVSTWNGIKNFFQTTWNGIRQIFTVAVNAIKGFLSRAWTDIRNAARTAWNGVKSAINSVWDGIKKTVGTPVYVVLKFINDPLISGFNKILSFVKLPKIPSIPGVASIPHFKRGGHLPGFGGGDKVPAFLEPGEAIIDKYTTRAHREELSDWGVPGFNKRKKSAPALVSRNRRAWLPGEPGDVGYAFLSGGQIEQVMLNFMNAKIGAPYSQSNRWGRPPWDCSSLLWDAAHTAGVPIPQSQALANLEANWFGAWDSDYVYRNRGEVRSGDLLFTVGSGPGPSKYGGIGHTGMAQSNSRMVSARGSAYGVSTSGISNLVVGIRLGGANTTLNSGEGLNLGGVAGAAISAIGGALSGAGGFIVNTIEDLLNLVPGPVRDAINLVKNLATGFGKLALNKGGGMADIVRKLGSSAISGVVGWVKNQAVSLISNVIGAVTGGSGGSANAPLGSGTSAGMMANGRQIYDYLLKNLFGGNKIAAAGATASIWGESTWNPFAVGTGGRGLIGWTPPGKISDATFKGGMATQLPAIIQYVVQNGYMRYVNMMKQAKTVLDAANIWGKDIERYGINDVHAQGVSLASSFMADRGGWLMPGINLVGNFTGQPEQILPPSGGRPGRGASIVWTGDVVIQGHALANKQEIGRTVSDALQYFADHGGKLPAARR